MRVGVIDEQVMELALREGEFHAWPAVREGAGGPLHHAGRRDEQTQLVVPGDVRAALSAHPDPHDSAARPTIAEAAQTLRADA
ncbi:MAG TPA: hypothetical protein VJ914_09065 [Pseudonocardiaceae bacterium]|nr:hypothetical protein [Pseudonocardiaceae bacterium]